MKRAPLFLALLLCGALPAFAQSTEFGVIVGGSRRFIDKDAPAGPAPRNNIIPSDFSFSNTSIELYWGTNIDDDTAFKIKVGRIETQVAEEIRITGNPTLARNDAEGEVQHLDASVEYKFSEAFGKTGIFGGVGFYRQTSDAFESTNNFGYHAGLNADFPMTRRYGFVVEAAYHWTRAAHKPSYLTIGGGLRIGF